MRIMNAYAIIETTFSLFGRVFGVITRKIRLMRGAAHGIISL